MKRSTLSFALIPLLAGCISSAPDTPTCWSIDKGHAAWPVKDAAAKTAGDVRIARVEVLAPYNGMRFAVLRPDGSLAFDAFNTFAVSPSALLKAAALEAVSRHGTFRHVLPSASAARTRYALEFDVVELALDCRAEGSKKAVVEVTATLLDGRDIVGIATARATHDDLKDGDYSAAFSTAFFHAVADALAQLPVK